MKETIQFDIFEVDKALEFIRKAAGEGYTSEMGIVASVAFSDKLRLPGLRTKETELNNFQEYCIRWSTAYLNGYRNRPSVRQGNPSGTISDSVVKVILQSRLPNISNELADKLEAGHSLMMTIENLIGELLEEYLANKLKESGWCCCWGSTIDAVDFCKADGTLLQVKTSDNSENSSSSRVRLGTTIKKWFRRVSKKADTFKWLQLNDMVGRTDLSETDFRDFIATTIKNNPNCIYLSDSHTLIKT